MLIYGIPTKVDLDPIGSRSGREGALCQHDVVTRSPPSKRECSPYWFYSKLSKYTRGEIGNTEESAQVLIEVNRVDFVIDAFCIFIRDRIWHMAISNISVISMLETSTQRSCGWSLIYHHFKELILLLAFWREASHRLIRLQ